MTSKEKIAILAKRKRFLMHRISESDKDLTFDKEELAALTWIIDLYLKEHNRDMKNKLY